MIQLNEFGRMRRSVRLWNDVELQIKKVDNL